MCLHPKDVKITYLASSPEGDLSLNPSNLEKPFKVSLNEVTEAQARAYEVLKDIRWKDVYYRTDIGYRAVEREKAS